MLLKHKLILITLLLLPLLSNLSASTPSHSNLSEPQVVNATKVKAFFSTYCVQCHGEQKQKKQIRVDMLDFSLSNIGSANAWQEVLDELNLGKMPPEEEKQPPLAEYTEVLSSLTDSLKAARERLASSGGKIALRHLNAREYGATLQDLFGMQIPRNKLPEDVNSEHFDTIGSGQYFTPYELDQYFIRGKQFIVDALDCYRLPKPKSATTFRIEPEIVQTKRAQKELAEMRRKMNLIKQGKTWQEIGFDAESTYKNFVTYYDQAEKKCLMVLESPEWKSGVMLGTEPALALDIVRMMDPGATYKLRARGATVGNLPGERALLKITGENETFGALSFNGTLAEPETIEMEFQTHLKGNNKNGFHIHKHALLGPKQYEALFSKYKEVGLKSPVWLDWIEIDGPYYDEPPFFETCLKPIIDQKEPSDDKVKALLSKFAHYCFRRTGPQKEYLDGLFVLYQKNRQFGLSAKESIADPLALILSSPGFLYMQEPSGEKKQVLAQREFAIRLSYFLWSAPPDDELYQLADQGTLYQPDVLAATVERMLASPKSRRFMDGFIEQWAELKRFDDVKTNKDFYQFMDVTRFSARKEPVEFFNVLVKENLPVANFIDSDFVVIDKTLSVFYDIPGKFDHRFHKVKLPPGSPRGGLLGQAFFLVMTSNGERTSPVKRGVFVMKKFLNHEPAPPPPNVPALQISDKKPLSMRELTMQHESKPQCASCHNKIDPLGFGMENFNVIGLWRDAEVVGKQTRPIDASVTLRDGIRCPDFHSFKQVLVKNKDTLARGLYEALSSYALGRRMEFTDRDEVDGALNELKAKHYRMKDMILHIAESENFRSK